MTLVLSILFWLFLALIAYSVAGYPLVLRVAAAFRSKHRSPSAESRLTESCTVLVVAHNEQDRIAARVRNILNSAVPPEKLSVLVVSDGSDDRTVVAAESVADPRVRVLALPVKGGKAAGLNAGMAEIPGGTVVLTDARQEFEPETIPRLLSAFADPRVGAVSGSLEIGSGGDSVSKGVDLYWRLEKLIRHLESRVDSSVGCTGAVYAIRREAFRELPPDTVLDDVIIPMQAVLQGYRVLFDPAARAWDPQPFSAADEKRRKRRTLAGNFQMLFRYPSWLLPRRNRLWWQLISHKYLRLLTPFLLLLLPVANILLALHRPVYGVLLAGQCLFYALALAGVLLPRVPLGIAGIPRAFLFLNLRVLDGFFTYLRGDFHQGWQAGRDVGDGDHAR